MSELVMAGSEIVARRLLAAAGVVVGGPNPWDVHVNDDRVWDRVIRDRELGLGESYMEGWWDTPALDQFLAKIMLADLKDEIRLGPELLKIIVKSRFTNRHSKEAAAENASAHYDIGNDLYERMLDDRMIYSCGYWANTTSLAEAQRAKLDLVCRKLQFEEGMTVLDIGCGWGGFSKFAAEEYGVIVTGISPAIEQVKLARQRTAGLSVTIEQADYRSVQGVFDRIVSIGMFEHVGPEHYKTFFEQCDRLLASDGAMLHHTIGSNSSKKDFDAWMDRYIFPGGRLPSLGQMATAAEPGFTIEDVHNLGSDYDTTLQAWAANIDSAWDDLPAYDETFKRMWHYYLMASMAGFRIRNTQLWQIVFRRTMHENGVWPRVS
jgi:cyclopropane-fatty-acyl-phospholipid synthase